MARKLSLSGNKGDRSAREEHVCNNMRTNAEKFTLDSPITVVLLECCCFFVRNQSRLCDHDAFLQLLI
jgi:hypothetical protein